MNTNHRTKKYIFLLFILSLLGVFIVMFFNVILYKTYDVNTDVDNNWEITYNGTTYKNVTLNSFTFHDLKKGDIIYLKHDLKAAKKLSAPMLDILTYHTALEVFVDNELIYEKNIERIKDDLFVGGGHSRVPLTDNCSNKSVIIKNYIREDDAFSHYMPIYLGETNNIYVSFFIAYSPYFIMSIFLFTFSLILLVPSIVFYKKFGEFQQLAFTSVFTIFVSIWTFCSAKFAQIFFNDVTYTTLTEYFSLYSATCINALIFYYIFKNKKQLKRLFLTIFCINLFFILLVSFLQLNNTMHVQIPLTLFHVITAIELVTAFIVISVSNSTPFDKVHMYMMNGLTIFITFAIMDLLRFDTLKFFNINLPSVKAAVYNTSILPYGTLIYIISLFISYALYISKRIAEIQEKDKLFDLAYNDCLTNIYNRTKCEDLMLKVEQQLENYIIVSIDLNGLKKLNDSKGHSFGDWLLSGFSNILKSFFSSYGYVGRMGGDEFIIILPELNKFDNIKNLMQGFLDRLAMENNKVTDFQYDFAYGFANRDEFDSTRPSARSVYDLADKRMYEMKVNMKKERKN